MKKRFSPFLYSCLFTFTSILSFPKLVLAQLLLGNGLQPGLDSALLDYQQQELSFNKLGVTSTKTDVVLPKINQVSFDGQQFSSFDISRDIKSTNRAFWNVEGKGFATIAEAESETLLADSLDEVGEGGNVSTYALTGVGGIALVLLLLAGSGGSGSDSNSGFEFIETIAASDDENLFTSFEVAEPIKIVKNSVEVAQPVTRAKNLANLANSPKNQTANLLEITEPSNISTLLFLSLICFFFYRRRFII